MITLNAFASFLGTTPESVQDLFNLFDKDIDGKILFSEFVAAITILNRSMDDEHLIELLFETLDYDKDGYLTVIEIKQLAR